MVVVVVVVVVVVEVVVVDAMATAVVVVGAITTGTVGTVDPLKRMKTDHLRLPLFVAQISQRSGNFRIAPDFLHGFPSRA